MLTVHRLPQTTIVEFSIAGQVAADDYARAVAQFEQIVREYGRVRVLKVIHPSAVVDPGAFREGLQGLLPEMSRVERAAIVADQSWVDQMMAVALSLYPCGVRFFPRAQRDEALAWLKQGQREDLSNVDDAAPQV
ncbi:MAG: STAS/SEC14 domain-containing protein [Chthoniobacterales bacterium]